MLAAQGHDVRVIVGSGVTMDASPTPTMIDGVSVETLDSSLWRQYHDRFAQYASMPGLRRHLAAAWAMWEQARLGEEADVVEATDWGLLFVPWALEDGPPSVVQMHGSLGQIDLHDPVRGEEAQGNLIRMIERGALSLSTAVQANSQSNAAFWSRQTGREVDRILPAWEPLLAFNPTVKRSSKGLVVGRIQRWKGPEVLCDALQLLGERSPSIEWIGRDTVFEQRDVLTSQHLQRNWPGIWGQAITQLPQQAFGDTARRQAAAAFLVVPSLWDTFNFTCVEAMGAGTPVVCSTGAGACELIEHDVNGFVFENGDASSLASALDRCQSLSPDDRHSIAEAGRQTVLRALSPTTICQQRLAAYENISRMAPRAVPSDSDFVRVACTPLAGAQTSSLAFLDQLPLKGLLEYSTRRVLRKFSR